MKALEQQLQEKALKANFSEVQQAHFDKLMSELEVISGGLGFSELKEKAEAGSKEALQVMRDYITKKEEVVEFIETKEMSEEVSDPDFEKMLEAHEEVKPGDVYVNTTSGERFEVVEVFDGVDNPVSSVNRFNPEGVIKIKIQGGKDSSAVFVNFPDEDSSKKLIVGLSDPCMEFSVSAKPKERHDVLELRTFGGFSVGEEFKNKIVEATWAKIKYFVWAKEEEKIRVVFEMNHTLASGKETTEISIFDIGLFAGLYTKIEQ